MSEPTTQRFGLPLLQPAQAQKHVTVNDALMRLDGLVNLVLQSASLSAPPLSAVDGQCWGVPSGGSGPWTGQDGQIAIAANGGWVFAQPQRGQRAFLIDRGVAALWDGAGWASGAITLGALGGGLIAGVTEGETPTGAGTTVATGVRIPAHSMVIGVTARVVEQMTGTVTSWSLGVDGAPDRFGSGLGVQLNSWAQGLQSMPTAYYADTELLVTAAGGSFAGGRVRLSVQWLALRLPSAA